MRMIITVALALAGAMPLVGLSLQAASSALAQDEVRGIEAKDVRWGPVPPVLPKGGEIAVLSGDPGKPGPLTVRLKLPAGYRIPPHQHPHTEPVTVLSGELRYGKGRKMDEASAARLSAGGYVHLPANEPHYAFALVETVVQITTEGPFGISYVNPADDPSRSP